MVPPEIIEYVRRQLAAGFSREAISQALLAQGWSAEDAAEAFSAAAGPVTPTQAIPQAGAAAPKGDRPSQRSAKTRRFRKWPVIAAVIVIIVIVAFFAVARSLQSERIRAADFVRVSNIELIDTQLSLYGDDHTTYPASLSSLFPAGQVPADPDTHAPYQYELGQNGTSYTICATLQDSSADDLELTPTESLVNGEFCINSLPPLGASMATSTATSTPAASSTVERQ